MAGIDEIKKRLEVIAAEVRANLPEIATTLTLSAKAMAERRIVDEGFGASYSKNDIPAWFLSGKELNKTGAAFLGKVNKRKTRKGVTNWAEFREAQGLQTAHVDLHYSNKMFANMQPGPVEINGDIYRAPLAATNTEAQNKMNWNRQRYGDFIGKAMTPEDFDTLGEVVTGEVIRVLENIKF